MEHQLTSYYSPQGFSHALTIYTFYREYSPRFQILSLRYLYVHCAKNKGYKIRKNELDARALIMFDIFFKNREEQYIRELADLSFQFSPEIGQEMLNRLRNTEENRNIEQKEEKKNNITHNHRKIDRKIVYQDSQNVHNSKINKDVLKICEKLCEKYKDITVINDNLKINNAHFNTCLENIKEDLIQKYKTFEDLINDNLNYTKDSIATFGKNEITLKQIFISLYLFISESEHKQELEKRLLEEMKEMKGQCTTGHLSRFINVIQGFTDDDSLIIKMSEIDQANAVIRTYITNELKKCNDEQIINGITDKNKEYIKFIVTIISKKLKEWKKQYGEIFIHELPKIVNNFTDIEIFSVE